MGSGASQEHGRLSSDLPLDEAFELNPIDALFDEVSGKPPAAFMDSIKPIQALDVIPKLLPRAENTYEQAGFKVKSSAVTAAKLSQEHLAAILKYVAEDSTPSFYSTMNGLCYSKEHRAHLKVFVPYIWLLMHALQKLQPYPEPKVHRGVKKDLRSQYMQGRVFTWWSFVSTTKTIKVLEKDIFCGKTGNRTIFSITLRQRQARDISPFSPLEEGEVLLPPGCRFRVVDAADMGNGLTIIDLEELPSKMYVMDLSSHVASEGQHQDQHSSIAATATSAATSSSSSKPAAAPAPLSAKGGGKSKPVQQADFSPGAASSKGQQPLTQNQGQPQQQAAAASPASATAAAAAGPSAAGNKSPPATTATPGEGKSASFWYELGRKRGGRVGWQEYSEKECYEKALSIDPKFVIAWKELGVVGGGKVGGQEYKRRACYETALTIDPKYEAGWFELGCVGLGGGKVAGQEVSRKQCFEAALAMNVDNCRYWFELAKSQGGRVEGQEYSGKECYEKALAIDPKFAHAWNGLWYVGGGQVHGKHYSKAECYAIYRELL